MRITNVLVVIAVSAVALGTMAYGATEVMQAKVPFAFYSKWGTMPAGRYEVTRNLSGINGVIRVQNADTGKGFVLMGNSSEAPGTNVTSLRFRCDDGCELIGIRSRYNVTTLPEHREREWKPRREASIIEIPVTVATGN